MNDETVSDRELNYVAANFVALRQQYAGMWIAVVGETVVAAAATGGMLRKLLDELRVETPFVDRIPAWGERALEMPTLWLAPQEE